MVEIFSLLHAPYTVFYINRSAFERIVDIWKY